MTSQPLTGHGTKDHFLIYRVEVITKAGRVGAPWRKRTRHGFLDIGEFILA